MSPFPRGRALVIGVGAYADSRWNVPPAAREARAIAAALTDPQGGGYGQGAVELLCDAEATRANTLASLGRLAARCDANSVALVLVTSHGAVGSDGLYYLATHDARFSEPPSEQILGGSGVNAAELARALRAIPAGQLLLVLNACFAGVAGAAYADGAILPETSPRGQLLPDATGQALAATGEGRAVIVAGRPEQRSLFDPAEEHTIFGQALLEALRGSATSALSGEVTLYELYNNLYSQVARVTLQRAGTPQEPVLTLLNNVGPFPVASYPGVGGGVAPVPTARPEGEVRVVERDVIQAIGQGATAIKAEQGSSVRVDNSKLIDFGSASVMGGVRIGDVAGGDIVKINSPSGAPADDAPDPLRDLPILAERVAVARNVDEDERDNAANFLRQAHRALAQGDRAKAGQRIEQALAILRAMDNGYIRSATRKIEAVRAAL